MKIGINELRDLIKEVLPATAERSTLPILQSFLVEIAANRIMLTGSNLETVISRSTECVTADGEGFAFCVPAKLFSELASKLVGDSVTLTYVPVHEVAEKDAPEKDAKLPLPDEEKISYIPMELLVKTELDTARLKTYDVKDFPEVNTWEFADWQLPITGTELARLLATSFACADEDTRPILQTVNLLVSDGIIRTQATNGFMLARQTQDIGDKMKGTDIDIMVPGDSACLIKDAVKGFENVVILGVNDQQQLGIRVNGTLLITTQLMDGQYPDTSPIIDGVLKPSYEYTLARKRFKQAVVLAKVFITGEIGVNMSFAHDEAKKVKDRIHTLTITGRYADTGRGSTEVIADKFVNRSRPKVDPSPIVFNCGLLEKGLTYAPCDTLVLGMNKPVEPLTLSCDGWLFLLMPMHASK